MANKLTIKTKFGVVPWSLLSSKTASWKAKGLFAYIQSKPEWWEFAIERMESKDGKDSTRSWVQELEELGYLERTRNRMEDGSFCMDYALYESPDDNPSHGIKPAMGSMAENPPSENPPSENPPSENPPSENPPPNKERGSKKEIVKKSSWESKDSLALEAPNDRNSEVDSIIQSIRYACLWCKPPRLYKPGRMERQRAWNIATAEDFWHASETARCSRAEFAAKVVIAASMLPYVSATYNAETVYANYAKVYDAAIKEKMKSNQQRGWTVEA